MMTSQESQPMLAPFFAGEGGYCHLLHVLLTAPTPLAQDFRKTFSARILKPKFDIEIGADSVRVESQFAVHPPGEVSQIIDLVMSLDNAVVGIEAKLFASSAKKGQLAAQYRGLRHCSPHEKRVHSLLIFPGPTSHHKEVKLEREGDFAQTVTWSEIFECLPLFDAGSPDVLLGEIISQARAQLEVIPPPITEVTPDRLTLKAEMDRAVVLFNQYLQEADDPLRGCTWRPTLWRSPRNDVYFGPLIGPDKKPRKGQSLVLKAFFQEAGESVPLGKYRVRVAFRLERKGGDTTYRPEFDAALPDCMKQLPPPAGERGTDGNGTAVYDDQEIRVNDDQVTTVAGDPAAKPLAELLFAYSQTFSRFLLRNSRVQRKTSAPKDAG